MSQRGNALTWWGDHDSPYRALYVRKELHAILFYISKGIAEELRVIAEALNHEPWNWKVITQAEFETYQAFGIEEIKL